MKQKYKRIMWAMLGAAAVLFILLYFSGKVEVTTIQTVPQTLERTIEEEGKIKAQRQWNLFPPAMLSVKAVQVKAGDAVKAGDILLELDARQTSQELLAWQESNALQLSQYRSELARVLAEKKTYTAPLANQQIDQLQKQVMIEEESHRIAEKKYTNGEQLYGVGAISAQELSELALSRDKALNELQQAQFALEQQTLLYHDMLEYYNRQETTLNEQIANLEQILSGGASDPQTAALAYILAESVLRAPVDGFVGRIAAAEGEQVNPQDPVVTIFQDQEYYAQVYLLSKEAYLVHPGMQVRAVVERPDQDAQLTGNVYSVADYAEEVLSTLGLTESRVKVEVLLNAEDRLVIEGPIDLHFIVEVAEDAIAVPKTAVFDDPAGKAVLAVEKGKAVLRLVTTGWETQNAVLIEEGLEAGTEIIITPDRTGLKAGSSVKIKDS